jgi:hypothetical protein
VVPLEGPAWRPISRRYNCACEPPGALSVRVDGVERRKRTYRVILHGGRSSGARNDRGESFPTLSMCGRVVRPCVGGGGGGRPFIRKIPWNSSWWRSMSDHRLWGSAGTFSPKLVIDCKNAPRSILSMGIMGGQDWVLTARTMRNWNHLSCYRSLGSQCHIVGRWLAECCLVLDPDHLIPDLIRRGP